MKRTEAVRRRIDAYQQDHTVPAVLVAVTRKFADDQAGNQVTVLAYAAFVTLFPLLLVAFTVLGLVLANRPSLHHRIEHSVLANFPLVGNQLQANVSTLHRSSTVGLVIGLLVTLWGSLAVAQAGINAMSTVWNVPGPEQPTFGARVGRSLGFLGVLGAGVIVTTFLAGVGSYGGTNPLFGVLGVVLALIVNMAQYLAAFRILTAGTVPTRALVPGSVVAGVGWTILQTLGGLVVGHYVKGAGAVYGTFGVVLGLLAWIYLGARLSVYSAELNAVLHQHLWPRTMVQPPLSEADRRAVELRQQGTVTLPQVRVHTTVEGEAMTQAEWLERHGGDGAGTTPVEAPSKPTAEAPERSGDGDR